VAPARRDVGQRRAGGDADEPAFGVERVEKPVQVALVAAAAVVQDQAALGVALGLPDQVDQGRFAVARRYPFLLR
jgi:hypothetical protein